MSLMAFKTCCSPVVDPGFPGSRGGRKGQLPIEKYLPIIWQKFRWELRENERNWTESLFCKTVKYHKKDVVFCAIVKDRW